MSSFEKLYTVDDIAKMTLLTTRTIRTYLKEGLLAGRKVGGQWRFTREDIEKLFANSSVEKEMMDIRRQDVMDFIDGVNTDIVGDIQTCAIVDYYCADKAVALELTGQLDPIISKTSVSTNRFSCEYIEDQKKSRYTFFGSPSFIVDSMQIIEAEWNRLFRTQRLFNDKASYYSQFRPSYPKHAVELILSLSKLKNPVIADIGAGTGKLSKSLLHPNTIVYAVEPNEDMRTIAEKELGGSQNYHCVSGTAEATGLDSDSIDIITVAEAYHWFDNEQTKLEFKRILKNDGSVVLLWNQFGGNPYDAEMDDINRRLCPAYREKRLRIPREERAVSLFGEGQYQTADYDNAIMQSFEAFLGGSLSASYAPRKDDENYSQYVAETRALYDKYSDGHLLETKITTVCYFGKL